MTEHRKAGRPRQTHCKWGHSLDDAILLRSGQRKCRQCYRESQTEIFQEIKAGWLKRVGKIWTPMP